MKYIRLVSFILVALLFLTSLTVLASSSKQIKLTIGSDVILVNGSPLKMDVAPFIKNGRTFVPLRFVSEALGAKVDYTSKPDGTTDEVFVSMGEEQAQVSQWVEVARWEGNSTKNTETFHIPSHDWRITWQANPEGDTEGNFAIYVYSASGEMVDLVANIIGKGGDTSYMRGAGDYYLEIISTFEKYLIIAEAKTS
jgi:hypothetical protein